MVSLVPMTQADFEAYRTGAIASLAREMIRGRDLSESEGMRAALASFQALFPDGRIDNPDLDVFQILAGEQKVGTAIFGIRRDKRRPYGYIWEIVIDPPHRRQGYAAQTMRLLEAHSRSLGLERIGLNVFGHNGAAIALYRKLGYEPESMILRKDLPAAGPT